MSAHTPGPWLISPVHPIGCTGFAIRAAGKEHSVVSLGVYENSSVDGSFQKSEADANARLIAAAPELLTELQQASAQMEMAAECITAGRYDEALLHVNSMCRTRAAAIAKAGGVAP